MSRSRFTMACAAAMLVAGAVSPRTAAQAQGTKAPSAPSVTLGKPLAEFPDGLTEPGAVRELGAGKLLVADVKEQRLVILDFASGEMRDAARRGGGPLEYRAVTTLLSLGDSVLVPDMMQQRFLVLSPTGAPVQTRPMLAKGQDMLALARVGAVVAVDSRRRFYTETRGMKIEQGKMPVMSDTLALVRWIDFGVRGETLATRLEKSPMPKMEGSPKDGMRMRVSPMLYVPRDAWAVMPDGRVVVLRVDGYGVRVIGADGKGGSETRVPYTPEPITAKDRAFAIRRTREIYEFGLKLGMSMAPSGTQMPKISLQVDEPAEWPKVKPPFTTAMVAPDGTVWVLRGDVEQAEPITYDVLDGAGRLLRRVRFPARTVLLGFGKGALYAARRDDDDLRYVQRYALPR